MATTTHPTAAVAWVPKLLVIDDDPNAHDLVDYYLFRVVSEIFHASSGIEGLTIAGDVRPDVILLDIEMAGMNGFEVCKRLKQQDATRSIPVLFLTKDRSSDHIARALDLGGFDYVTKPFVPVELQARVRSALRNKLSNDVLREQARSDPLTNLPNRRSFDEGLRSSLANFQRNACPFALLLLDLDHFKAINDTYGHGVGDEVLIQVADTIRRTSRPYDLPARCGGEEFALILNRSRCDEATATGERLLQEIRSLRISPNGGEVTVTASAGLACATGTDPDLDISASQIYERADAALYEAKQRGRDRLVHSV